MRKYIVLSFLLIFVLTPSVSAHVSNTPHLTEVTESTSEGRMKKTPVPSRIEKIRQDAKTKVKTSREEFKERAAELKDERKQKVVENLDEKVSQMNDRWTSHFDRVLTRLTELLKKVEARADKKEEAGADVSKVRELIETARTAIAAAKAANDAQAAKEYVITITDEANLGQSVKTVMQELRTDIKAVRELVDAARKAVHAAIEAVVAIQVSVTPVPTRGE